MKARRRSIDPPTYSLRSALRARRPSGMSARLVTWNLCHIVEVSIRLGSRRGHRWPQKTSEAPDDMYVRGATSDTGWGSLRFYAARE